MIPNAAKDGSAIRELLSIGDGAVNLVPFVDCCRIQRGGSGGDALSGDKLRCGSLSKALPAPHRPGFLSAGRITS